MDKDEDIVNGGGVEGAGQEPILGAGGAQPPVIIPTGFDPAIHQTYDDGTPKLNPSGGLKKKPGRKQGVSPDGAKSEKKTPLETRSDKVSCDALASALLNTVVGVSCELIGPEWEFENKEEATALKSALSAYLQAKESVTASPEILLILAASGYALPRIRHQNTRSKLSRFFGGIGGIIKSWFK